MTDNKQKKYPTIAYNYRRRGKGLHAKIVVLEVKDDIVTYLDAEEGGMGKKVSVDEFWNNFYDFWEREEFVYPELAIGMELYLINRDTSDLEIWIFLGYEDQDKTQGRFACAGYWMNIDKKIGEERVIKMSEIKSIFLPTFITRSNALGMFIEFLNEKKMSETKEQPNLQEDSKSQLSDEVKKLKKILTEFRSVFSPISFDEQVNPPLLIRFANQVQSLLNVFDKIDSQPEVSKPVDYQKEEKVKDKEEKPESIWKPVSELPKQHDNVYADIPCVILDGQGYCRFGLFSVKHFYEHNGRRMETGLLNEPIKYATLTDFINEHNNLLKRIAEVERILMNK